MIGAVLHTLRVVRPDVFDEVDFAVLLNASEEVMAVDFSPFCDDVLARNLASQPATATAIATGQSESDRSSCLACLVFEAGAFLRNSDASERETHSYKIVTSRKGMCVWKIGFSGLAAHAGNNHAGGWLSHGMAWCCFCLVCLRVGHCFVDGHPATS